MVIWSIRVVMIVMCFEQSWTEKALYKCSHHFSLLCLQNLQDSQSLDKNGLLSDNDVRAIMSQKNKGNKSFSLPDSIKECMQVMVLDMQAVELELLGWQSDWSVTVKWILCLWIYQVVEVMSPQYELQVTHSNPSPEETYFELGSIIKNTCNSNNQVLLVSSRSRSSH